MKKKLESKARILAIVAKDLDPSLIRVVLYLIFSFVFGGAISMLICGQCGFGFSPFAINISHKIHSHLNPVGCALICGCFFSILPVLILKLITHPLFFKAILKKYHLFSLALVSSFGLYMYLHSNLNLEILYILTWIASSYCMFKYLGQILEQIKYDKRKISI